MQNYLKNHGAYSFDDGYIWWWQRSFGDDTYSAASISNSGAILMAVESTITTIPSDLLCGLEKNNKYVLFPGADSVCQPQIFLKILFF